MVKIKEKAKDHANYLINKFVSLTMHHQFEYIVDGVRLSLAKKSALILVDEIIRHQREGGDLYLTPIDLEYWQKVKQEINNF